MTNQKWRKKLEARFGRMPQEAIEDSEIDILRGYFDHRDVYKRQSQASSISRQKNQYASQHSGLNQ